MAWIYTIPPDEAEGVLAEAYAWQASRLGEPAEFTRLGSLHPELVLERLRLYKVVEETPSGLTPAQRHLVAFTVSRLNETPHCSSGLRHKLADVGAPSELVGSVDADPRHPSSGDARTDAILGYTAKLTVTPGEIVEEDVTSLRSVGLTDFDILDVNNLVAYYNYINRVANGLGLRTAIPLHEALSSVPR